jgi:hypothetical protein
MVTIQRVERSIIGFRLTHGSWPTRIYIDAPLLLEECRHLEDGYLNWIKLRRALELRVPFTPSVGLPAYLTADDSGRRFDYQHSEFDGYYSDRARGLLGVWLSSLPPVDVPGLPLQTRRLPWGEAMRTIGETGMSTLGTNPPYIDLGLGPCSHLRETLGMPIEATNLSNRSKKRLMASGSRTLRDVVTRSPEDLLSLDGFGKACIDELAALLYSKGLGFAMEIAEVETGLLVISEGRDPMAVAQGLVPAVPEAHDHILLHLLPSDVATALLTLMDDQPPSAPVLQRVLEALNERSSVVTNQREYPVKALQKYASGMTSGFLESLNGGPAGPLVDLTAATSHLDPLDRRVTIAHLGLDGSPGSTLEAIAQELGVSRERVRQRVRRFEEYAKTLRPSLPFSGAATAELESASEPMSLFEWWSRLPEMARPSTPEGLAAIRQFEEWGWLPARSWQPLGTTFMVGTVSDQPRMRHLADLLDAAVARGYSWGVIHESTVADLCGCARSLARGALLGDERLIEGMHGWFLRRENDGGALGRRIPRVLAALGPLPVSVLRRGLKRAIRKPMRGKPEPLPVPPAKLLLQLASREGAYVARDGTCSPNPDWRLEVSPTDKALLAAFEGAAAVAFWQIDEAFLQHGLSIHSARMTVTYSPLVSRLEYGVYGLLGRTAGEPDRNIARAKLFSRVNSVILAIDHLPGGSIVLRLATDHLPRGTAPLPIGHVPVGDWTFEDENGTTTTVKVGRTYATKLGRLAREIGAAEVGFIIHPESRLIRRLV